MPLRRAAPRRADGSSVVDCFPPTLPSAPNPLPWELDHAIWLHHERRAELALLLAGDDRIATEPQLLAAARKRASQELRRIIDAVRFYAAHPQEGASIGTRRATADR